MGVTKDGFTLFPLDVESKLRHRQTGPTMEYVPKYALTTANAGNETIVTVQVVDATDWNAAYFALVYDPDKMSLSALKYDEFLGPDSEVFRAADTGYRGKITSHVCRYGSFRKVPKSGSGDLFTLTFTHDAATDSLGPERLVTNWPAASKQGSVLHPPTDSANRVEYFYFPGWPPDNFPESLFQYSSISRKEPLYVQGNPLYYYCWASDRVGPNPLVMSDVDYWDYRTVSVWANVFLFQDKNIGDYNNDGTVGIEDEGPLAEHYLHLADHQNPMNSTDLNDPYIDGNLDGECNIADLQPIANHYETRVAGYKMYVKGLHPFVGLLTYQTIVIPDAPVREPWLQKFIGAPYVFWDPDYEHRYVRPFYWSLAPFELFNPPLSWLGDGENPVNFVAPQGIPGPYELFKALPALGMYQYPVSYSFVPVDDTGQPSVAPERNGALSETGVCYDYYYP